MAVESPGYALKRISVLLLLLVFLSAPVLGQAAEYGRDLHGRAVMSLGNAGTKAVVLYFVASDCPVSNRTFPEMKRVREEFAGRGVRFWFVYPNEGERVDVVREHQQSYDEGGEAILDATGMLVRMTGAKVTPEAAVLVPGVGGSWTPVFVGRVDDKYVRLGLERPVAAVHFAERAVRDVLEGKPVEQADGKLVGCGIVSPGPERAAR